MNSLLDSTFNGMGAGEMYRAWTAPGVFPDQPQPRLENWPKDDLEMYCGIYE
ncbi:hypothetical protein [Nocardia terpenica]|uniref:hypothetical protein n=1 Tax=Nocardia terpenica TaxID=455432 RepID=UPI0002E59CE9|nr:hypothetical protein [Nocardia terpenica]NQE88087.1 hypothetical protein [Nocardia terpenica]